MVVGSRVKVEYKNTFNRIDQFNTWGNRLSDF